MTILFMTRIARHLITLGVVVLALSGLPEGAVAQATPDTSSVMSEVQRALADVRKTISGRESERADSVFKNVQLLATVPAGRFLRIMEMGYARSLGVSCAHCHDLSAWESDVKEPKRVARQMAHMVQYLNAEYLPSIPELSDAKPTVNCTTCHRGNVIPALRLPSREEP